MNVAIVGGGYAGMAAAVTLADRGIPVTVFEAAAHLGGRARRVRYNETALDNGLHVLVGACRETLRLIRRVNRDCDDLLFRLPFDWRIHRRFRLRALPLPAPLHLACGLLAASGVGLNARLAAVKFMREMRAREFRLAQDVSVAQLLRTHQQDERVARFLWRPLCIAALNTPPEEASAQVFLNMLRDSLDARRSESAIVLSRRDLTALFPDPAADHVRHRGGEILLGHTVAAITIGASGFSVHARGGHFDFSHVICALPPHRLLPVIRDLPQLDQARDAVGRFQYQPIYSIYLQYPGRVALPSPMLGLAGGHVHWVFDRETICGQKGLVAAVISASGPHQDITQEELARRVHGELKAHVAGLPAPLWTRVIAEKRATFACTVGLERPAQSTALGNFYLAGDYTASDYPATIEAAVRSGVRCADAIPNSGS
jgi:squalene-associated FAD-dependent desaturase